MLLEHALIGVVNRQQHVDVECGGRVRANKISVIGFKEIYKLPKVLLFGGEGGDDCPLLRTITVNTYSNPGIRPP